MKKCLRAKVTIRSKVPLYKSAYLTFTRIIFIIYNCILTLLRFKPCLIITFYILIINFLLRFPYIFNETFEKIVNSYEIYLKKKLLFVDNF